MERDILNSENIKNHEFSCFNFEYYLKLISVLFQLKLMYSKKDYILLLKKEDMLNYVETYLVKKELRKFDIKNTYFIPTVLDHENIKQVY